MHSESSISRVPAAGRLRVLAVCLSLFALLVVTGCGVGDQDANPKPAEEPDVATKDTNLPDPRTITGLSEVAEIGDPEVIEGTYKVKLPVTVTDFEGKKVQVKDSSRILPLDLTGNISRTLVALGMADSIVGRTVSSTEEVLKDVPVVTKSGHSVNVEAALTLRPTLVLTDKSVGPVEAFDQLAASGVPVVVLDSDHSLKNLEAGIEAVAKAVGMDQAGQALAKRARGEVDAAEKQIAAWVPEQPLKIIFLYVRGTAGVFFILGPEEGSTALIESVGGSDVAAAANLGSVTPASAEALLATNPEIYFTMSGGLDSTGGVEGFFARDGVADTIAGKHRRVVAIPDGMSLSFGPQSGQVLLNVARALYGVKDR
ncbi:MAG: ABC transporter substrate-binding protein [Varibaculum sp.]|nr:ABC transporter substrate-binding protein [Varibaculum sp.]